MCSVLTMLVCVVHHRRHADGRAGQAQADSTGMRRVHGRQKEVRRRAPVSSLYPLGNRGPGKPASWLRPERL